VIPEPYEGGDRDCEEDGSDEKDDSDQLEDANLFVFYLIFALF
jgi:hypothetical protein